MGPCSWLNRCDRYEVAPMFFSQNYDSKSQKLFTYPGSPFFLAEAGGIVTDASGNNLDFSKGRFLDLDTGIIATNKQLMPSLLNAVQEAIKEQNQASSLL
jgi:3'(2'), 5'-bisphosphate nucleotidase / inositol polyphosphate 1-phosphatase